MDDEIDDLYQQIQRELLTHMLENPKSITPAIKLLNVARYLERLGDHLENVNEHIIFWLTGERL
jgi:phosphate transport system protein